MRDGPFLSVFKRITAGCYAVDVRISRWIAAWREGREQYVLRGACNDCGKCCETPMVIVPLAIYRINLSRRLCLWWHHHVNGFVYIGEDPESSAFIFRCTHWDVDRRRCDSYATRPGMCRDYPLPLLQSSKPDFFSECGFYPVYRNADAMREALEDLDLSPEKLEELTEKLHLR